MAYWNRLVVNFFKMKPCRQNKDEVKVGETVIDDESYVVSKYIHSGQTIAEYCKDFRLLRLNRAKSNWASTERRLKTILSRVYELTGLSLKPIIENEDQQAIVLKKTGSRWSVYPLVDDTRIYLSGDMKGQIWLPGYLKLRAEELNKRFPDVELRFKVKAVNILAKKGYDVATRYLRCVKDIGLSSYSHITYFIYRAWDLLFDKKIVDFRGLKFMLVDDQYLIAVSNQTDISGKPLVYMLDVDRYSWPLTYLNVACAIRRIAYGNEKPVDSAKLYTILKDLSKNELKMVIPYVYDYLGPEHKKELVVDML